MADGGNDVFVYLGGEQEVPDGVTHAIIIRPSTLFEDEHSQIVISWYLLYFMMA